MRTLLSVAFVVLFLLGSGMPVFAEEIVVSTGKTFMDKVFTPLKDHLKNANLLVSIVPASPVDALKNLEAGSAEIAGASLSLEDWLKLAEKSNYQVKDKASLVPFTVAQEETGVIINSANTASNLTREQIKAIFSGKITNWKEVGGKDAPIIVVWPKMSSGGLDAFRKTIMGGEPVMKEVFDVNTIGDTPDAVVITPESIAVANVDKLPPQVTLVASSKMLRPLVLLTKGTPSPAAQKLIDYLKGEGQKYIK